MLDLVLAGQRQRRARSPCTRRTARAWPGTARRCCRVRRPRWRARRRAHPCSACLPTSGPEPAADRRRRRRDPSASRRPDPADGVAAGVPKARWASAAEPQASARLASTEPGRPSASSAALDGTEPGDRLEQASRRSGQVGPAGPQAGEADGQEQHRELGRVTVDDEAASGEGVVRHRRPRTGPHPRPPTTTAASTSVSEQAEPTGDQRGHHEHHRRAIGPSAVEDVPETVETAGQALEEVGAPLLDRRGVGRPDRQDDHDDHGRDHDSSDVARASPRATLGDDPEHRRAPPAARVRGGSRAEMTPSDRRRHQHRSQRTRRALALHRVGSRVQELNHLHLGLPSRRWHELWFGERGCVSAGVQFTQCA